MSIIHFVDVDDTLCLAGTDDLDPEGVSQVRAWLAHRDQVILFTCRPLYAEWPQKFREQGFPIERMGYLHKPLADHYCLWDDKLLAAGHKVGKQEFPDPARGLWFSNQEVAQVLGEDALNKLRGARL